MTRRVLVGLALLLLLPPAGQAQALGTLECSTVTVDASGFLGPLAGVAWTLERGNVSLLGTAAIELPAFSLAAASAEVTVYHAERYMAMDGGEPTPTRFDLTNLTLEKATGDHDARVLAVPAGPDAMLALAGPVRLTAGQAGAWKNPPRVGHEPQAVDTQQALQVKSLGDGLVQLTGSLRLVLDGIDFDLITSAGAQTIHTRTDVAGDAQVNVGRIALAPHSTVHEAIVELKGATLTMPASEVHVLSATVSGREWSLTSTNGRLSTAEGDRSAQADALNLAGDLEATLQRLDGQRIQAGFAGDLDGLSLDGHSVGLVRAPAAGVGWAALPWLALGIALASTLHLASGRWRFKRLDHAMDRKDYAGALRLSRRFRGHPLLAQDAALAAAICLLALGRPADARDRLASRAQWSIRRRPTRDFLLARAEAALGRTEAAARSLARSLVAEPSLLVAAKADALLDAILRASRPAPPEEAYA